MADITLGTGAEDLRSYILNGDGNHDIWKAFIKGLQGDFVFDVSPATTAPTPTTEAWGQEVTITLKSNNGEVHTWYNGPIKLAIANTSTAGTATIDPSDTTPNMENGVYTVTIAGDAASWLNSETATLTVSDPDTTGIGGWAVADATCVITFTA